MTGEDVLLDRSGTIIQYRILDPRFFPRPTVYHALLLDKHKAIAPFLLSPEQIEQLGMQAIETDYDENMSQVFTLGMLLLRLALLDDLE